MNLRRGIVSIVFIFAHGPASANGAVAVGSTGNVAKDGVSMANSVNFATDAEAQQAALKTCRGYDGSPKAAALCKVVATFKGECYADASDPKPATSGFGWAVASTKELAEEQALEHCKKTAGRDRKRFCVVGESKCDQPK